MAKSLVEKFHQILGADPASMVFVELAKALLEQGDVAGAEEICRAGVAHHPESILGRVLLGRALLAGGAMAEASNEFADALAIDSTNPYGYNLVAELLMKHQRYVEAAPILERALELQPGDLRIKRWLREARGEVASEAGEADPRGHLELTLSADAPDGEASPGDAPLDLVEAAEPESDEKAPPPLPPRRSGGRPRVADILLADLPDPAPRHTPVPVATTPTVSEVQRIADSYEQKLRAELELERTRPQGFVRRHWLAVTLAATVVFGVLVALSIYQITRRRYHEQHAQEFLARARQGLLLDTFASLSGALDQMNELLEVEPTNPQARAVAAQAQAAICHDFGCADAQRALARTQAEDPAVAKADPEATLVARWALGGPSEALSQELLRLPASAAGSWSHYLAGNALLAAHNEAEALRRFDLGLKITPSHVPLLLSVGENDLQQGEVARAAEVFGFAHAASPSNVGAVVGLAEAHLAARQPLEEDEHNLAQVATGGPQTIPTSLRQRLDLAQARVLAADGHLDQAVALLQSGLAAHGDEFDAYSGALADCYLADGQYDRAETEAWRALSHSRQDPESLARYAEILLARGRGRELLQRVPAVQGNRRLHVLRAQAALDTGSLALATAEIEATRKDNKVPAVAGVISAEILAKAGHRPEAKQALRQIVGLAHPPVEAYLALATLEHLDGEEVAALADAQRAVAADPRSYEAHCLDGRLLVLAGKTDQAEQELLAAIRRNRQHVEAQVALGLLYLERAKPELGRPVLQAAVRDAPDDAAANLALARDLLALGQTSDALRAATRAVKATPQDGTAHHWLGKIALAAGDRKLALRELKEAKRLDKKDRGISADLALAEKKKR